MVQTASIHGRLPGLRHHLHGIRPFGKIARGERELVSTVRKLPWCGRAGTPPPLWRISQRRQAPKDTPKAVRPCRLPRGRRHACPASPVLRRPLAIAGDPAGWIVPPSKRPMAGTRGNLPAGPPSRRPPFPSLAFRPGMRRRHGPRFGIPRKSRRGQTPNSPDSPAVPADTADHQAMA